MSRSSRNMEKAFVIEFWKRLSNAQWRKFSAGHPLKSTNNKVLDAFVAATEALNISNAASVKLSMLFLDKPDALFEHFKRYP